MTNPGLDVSIIAGTQVPVMPLPDIAGSAGGMEFWHNGPIESNSGVISGSIVISRVVSTPHCSGSLGSKVKENIPGASVLMDGGSQAPVIPLLEMLGSGGGTVYWQSGPIGSKMGMTNGFMFIWMVIPIAHCPVSGVKIKRKVPGSPVEITGGTHVPVMPFREIAGNMGGTVFTHSVPMGVNIGVNCGSMVISMII